jgi:hypothetical protein
VNWDIPLLLLRFGVNRWIDPWDWSLVLHRFNEPFLEGGNEDC